MGGAQGVQAEADSVLAPDVKFHADGLLHPEDLHGVKAFLHSADLEHRAYQLLDRTPLVRSSPCHLHTTDITDLIEE